jgi:hypothetical protein
MNGRSDLESLLSETLRAVGDQTVADRREGFELIRRDLARPIRPDRRLPRFGPRGYWLAVAAVVMVAAGLAVVKVGDGANTVATGSVRDDLVSADGRLYLLPPEDTDLRLGVFSTTNIAPDGGSGIVIGRPTQLGFDHLAFVAYRPTAPACTTNPCVPGDPLPFDFSGERYHVNANSLHMHGGSRPLPDGSVFEYATGSGISVHDEVDKAIGFSSENQTVRNGQIVFNQPAPSSNRFELEQIGQVADISHRQVVELIYPPPTDDSVLQALANTVDTLTLITQASNGGDDELLYLAAQGGATSVERITVWGTPGYKLLTVPGGTTGLVWHSSTGHVVALMTSLGEAKTLALAEGLRSVDETTWTTELAKINGQ